MDNFNKKNRSNVDIYFFLKETNFVIFVFQDSGVVVSEASQGSIEVLDKSTTSQWSVSEGENASGESGRGEQTDARWDDGDADTKQPDSMTPDEAEILLSSR